MNHRQTHLTVLLTCLLGGSIAAFVPPPPPVSNHGTIDRGLAAGNFFDEIGKIFNGSGNNDPEDEGKKTSNNILDAEILRGGAIDENTFRLFEIPAKSMKPGGLRLFLSLHLMGQQNTPNKGSWKALQMEDGAAIDMVFHDESGSLAIRFFDDKIAVDRLGKAPSLQYLIQESVILQGFLDELSAICFEGDVEEGNRLLVMDEPGDWIERARATTSFS